jgi:hypothetical protein
MSVWSFIKSLSLWSSADADLRREQIRLARFNSFEELEEFGDRSDSSDLSEPTPVITMPDYVGASEIHHLARRHQTLTTRHLRLSILIVDYLLEHEWIWLLTGQHRAPTRQWHRAPDSRESVHPLLP